MKGNRGGAAVLLALAAVLASAGTARAQETGATHINPASLVKPNGFTHVIVAPDRRTVYISGQVANDSTGALVGTGDFRAQADQVYGNLRRALEAVGATFGDVVKTTTFVADVKNIAALREVRAKYLDPARPPTNTLIPVPTLARPELMLEIEAIAVLRAPYPR